MSHNRALPNVTFEEFFNALTKASGYKPAKVHFFPRVFTYSFKLLDELTLAENVKEYLDIGAYKEMALKAMSVWQEIANIQFVEDDEAVAAHHIVRFVEEKSDSIWTCLRGFVSLYPSRVVAFNANIFNNREFNPKQLSTMVHEFGHVLMLYHPFESPFALTDPFQQTRSFSIMNYEYQCTKNLGQIIPVTPLPLEMKIVQELYGPQESKINNLYHLRDYIPFCNHTSFLPQDKTLSSFWDAGGNDTLSAKGIVTPVIMNIRQYSTSEIEGCAGYLLLPHVDIENIISGSGSNKLYLNELSNIVKIEDAKFESAIYIDGTLCGNDVIFGFSPTKDFIILEQLPTDGQLEMTIQSVKNDTIIFLDKNNTILLKNVPYHELQKNSIQVVKNPRLIRQRTLNHIEIPDAYPVSLSDFVVDFGFAYSRGLVSSTLSTMIDGIFRKSQLSEKQILTLKTALLLATCFLNNSLLTSCSMIVLNTLMTQFLKLTRREADYLNIVINELAYLNQPFGLLYFLKAINNIHACIWGQATSLIVCRQISHFFTKTQLKKDDDEEIAFIDLERQVPKSKNTTLKTIRRSEENNYGCFSRVKKLYQNCRFFPCISSYFGKKVVAASFKKNAPKII